MNTLYFGGLKTSLAYVDFYSLWFEFIQVPEMETPEVYFFIQSIKCKTFHCWENLSCAEWTNVTQNHFDKKSPLLK